MQLLGINHWIMFLTNYISFMAGIYMVQNQEVNSKFLNVVSLKMDVNPFLTDRPYQIHQSHCPGQQEITWELQDF